MFFGKKKKNGKEEALSPDELAKQVSESAGLLPDEILKLLDSIAKVEDNRPVYRKKDIRAKLSRKNLLPILEAVELSKTRLEQRKEREEKLRRFLRKKLMKPVEFESREVITDDEYPKRLTPYDIAESIETAKNKLISEQEESETRETIDRKAAIILKVLDRLRLYEAVRVARMVAERQKMIAEISLEEAEKLLANPPAPELEEELDETEEISRSLQGFGKGMSTLVDEAKEVVKDDLDAAASVMQQWIGHVSENE